jgi:hypothetical protein
MLISTLVTSECITLEAPLNRQNQAPPPWDVLLGASRNTLQSYELSRLNHAANIGKEIRHLMDSYIEESSNAMLARLLMEEREHQPEVKQSSTDEVEVAAAPSASDNFLENQGLPKAR